MGSTVIASPNGWVGLLLGGHGFGGKLEVRFLDGFAPQAGDVFEFVQVEGGITGAFVETSFVDLSSEHTAKVEAADDGKLRLAIDDADDDGPDGPAACGGGLCGAGVAPLLPAMLLGMLAMRSASRRRRARPGDGKKARLNTLCKAGGG